MMDYVAGELLIYRIRRCPDIEKQILFRWFHQLLTQIEQYQKCKNQQCYRYVNPYSVLITQDEQILLLDLDAESNAFVLKNLQKRAMRNHFVKPVVHIKENTKISLDLYGYAKTIQFILAATCVAPSLTGWEKHRLVKLIDRCLNENPKKQYEDLQQVKRDLPIEKIPKEQKNRKWILIISLFVLLTALLCGLYYRWTLQEKYEQQKKYEEEVVVRQKEKVPEEENEDDKARNLKGELDSEDGLDSMEEELHVIEEYLLRNTVKDNQEVIRQGKILQRNLLRYLAAAYDREEEKEKALETYRTLCDLETQSEYLQTAYIRRIALEIELFEYGEEAVLTAKEAQEKFPHSEAIALRYAEALWLCREISTEEKQTQMQELSEAFSAVRESEYYRNWINEQNAEREEKRVDGVEKNGT